jgi:Zn-dependent protease
MATGEASREGGGLSKGATKKRRRLHPAFERKPVLSNQMIQNLLLQLPGLLLGISVHEMAHGYAAYLKGDYTAKLMGRLTLNPVKHIDPFGTVLVPIMLALSGGPIFGWAKPVPVSTINFKSPRKDHALVGLAGPASNFVLAVVLGVLLRILLMIPGPSSVMTPLILMVFYAIIISVFLGVLNLIPIHPLDGSHVLTGILPAHMAQVYSRHERYGFIILLILIFTNVLVRIIQPIASVFSTVLFSVLGMRDFLAYFRI